MASQEIKSNAPSAKDNKTDVINSLEEEDEFEDFPDDTNWNDSNKDDEQSNLWVEDWEDEDNQDEFTQRLRDELKKAQKSA